VKNILAFDSLRVMITSLSACVPLLLWSSLAFFFVEMMAALSLNSILSDEIENPDRSLEERTELFKYFGTFTRSIMTITELTFGNFIPVCRFLTENIGEGFGHAILIYKVTVGFSMLSVITGVFLHETFKAAASDDDLMVVQKKRAQQKHEKKMMHLFQAANPTYDSCINRAEFARIFEDQTLKTWLSAQDVEVKDVHLLFDLMDSGEHLLSLEDLIQGIARLKGTARSLDLIGLMHVTSHLFSHVSKNDANLNATLAKLEAKLDSVAENFVC